MKPCDFHGSYLNTCVYCRDANRTSDEALAELRRMLAGDSYVGGTVEAPMVQYDQDWNLTITGPDFVTRGTPDWMVDVVGEGLHKQINEIMEEARAKISDVVGENYNVSLDHI